MLEAGTALIISPPNSVGTEIQTPEGSINIAPDQATAMRPVVTASLNLAVGLLAQNTSDLLALPDRSSAVMVVHDAQNGLTQIFALTDGSTISNRSGTNAVELHGGRRSRSLRALPLSPMVQAIKTNSVVDFGDQPLSTVGNNGELNGGRSNNAHLSGNNAVGTVFENGRATRIEVFGVKGDRRNEGETYPDTLTNGIAPEH